MKEMEKLKNRTVVRLWRTVSGLVHHPALGYPLTCLVWMGAGIFLAPAGLSGHALPLAAGVIGAASSPVMALSAMLGSALGYLYFWGFSGGMEMLTLSVLIFGSVCTVGTSTLAKGRWFMPLTAVAMALIVGILQLAKEPFTPWALLFYLVKVSATGGTVLVFHQIRRDFKNGYLYYIIVCFLMGLGQITLLDGLTWGHLVGLSFCAAAAGTPISVHLAAVVGVALDWVGGGAMMTGLLVVSAFAVLVVKNQNRPLGQLVYLLAVSVYVCMTGAPIPELIPACAVGGFLSLLVPQKWFYAMGEEEKIMRAKRQLSTLSRGFSKISSVLTTSRRKLIQPSMASIFDDATEKVCTNCIRFHQCWRQESQKTFQEFCTAATPMMERGYGKAEDFSENFRTQCGHMEGLLAVMNQELYCATWEKRYYNRMEECQKLFANQYDILANSCESTAKSLEKPKIKPSTYVPEIGVESKAKKGNYSNGDRVLAFYADQNHYCILLCDGMGSGQAAAAESQLSAQILQPLLQAGLPPQDAIEMLNGLYILRENTGFSTVDLAILDLSEGFANLYKWGAAPSYWKGETTEKVGTATPPPGLGVGETRKAQEVQLYLGGGERLILLSDGVDDPGLERLIGGWRDCDPRELAGTILSAVQGVEEDDRTVVVVGLRLRASM